MSLYTLMGAWSFWRPDLKVKGHWLTATENLLCARAHLILTRECLVWYPHLLTMRQREAREGAVRDCLLPIYYSAAKVTRAEAGKLWISPTCLFRKHGKYGPDPIFPHSHASLNLCSDDLFDGGLSPVPCIKPPLPRSLWKSQLYYLFYLTFIFTLHLPCPEAYRSLVL